MILIADSGSSKTDWVFIDQNDHKQLFSTAGLNPYFVKPEDFQRTISEGLALDKSSIRFVYFYGAGCSVDQKRNEVEHSLNKIFVHAKVMVEPDLLGAARALCHNKKGIACILGTGSNACIFNGIEIVDEANSLGFILGDEGGGSHLGKQLITAYLYNELPDDLLEKFIKEFQPDKATILEHIYRKPFPNRYLANFVPFLVQHKNHKYVHTLVYASFQLFITRHVKTLYNYTDFECHFVGSVAFVFESILRKCAEANEIKIGEIMNKPIDGLIHYHGTKN